MTTSVDVRAPQRANRGGCDEFDGANDAVDPCNTLVLDTTAYRSHTKLRLKLVRLIRGLMFPAGGGIVRVGASHLVTTRALLRTVGSSLDARDVIVLRMLNKGQEFDQEHLAIATRLQLKVVSELVHITAIRLPGNHSDKRAAKVAILRAGLRRRLLAASAGNTDGNIGTVRVGSGTGLSDGTTGSDFLARGMKHLSTVFAAFLTHASAKLTGNRDDIEESAGFLSRAFSALAGLETFADENLLSASYFAAADLSLLLGLCPPSTKNPFDSNVKRLSVFKIVTRTATGGVRTAVLLLARDSECYAEEKVLNSFKVAMASGEAELAIVHKERRAIVRQILQQKKEAKAALLEQRRLLDALTRVVRDGAGRPVW